MVSMDMREVAGGFSCWDEQEGIHSVGINPEYGSGSLSAVIPLQRNIFLITQYFSLRGNAEIQLVCNEPYPSFLEVSVSLSGITRLSYDHPRISLGQGFADIAVPGHRQALAITVAGNTPVRTVNVCIPLSGFAGLTGQDVEQLITNLACLDNQADKAIHPRRSKALDMAQQACACQIFSVCRHSPP